jgi:hypothetical protein
MHRVADERSLGELFSDLWQETRTLINHEMRLARLEMSQKASQVGKDVTYLAIGGFVAYAGFLAILLAVIVGLSNLIPLWLSALIVGAVVALVGFLLIQKGRSDLQRQDLTPKKTVATMKENVEWARDQMR